MKTVFEILVMLFLLTSLLFDQNKNYWANAPLSGDKIYTIFFVDKINGFAISSEKQVFNSFDSGFSWKLNYDQVINVDTENIYWSAEIYCSVMKSTDGGETWFPYIGDKQDHFCKVYLKDPNVDYKSASEFLSKISKTVNEKISIDHINNILNHPQQCTEYFSNESEGWALGWCIKNFVMKKDN